MLSINWLQNIVSASQANGNGNYRIFISLIIMVLSCRIEVILFGENNEINAFTMFEKALEGC